MEEVDCEPKWWTEEYGFFGDYYMEGDNSIEGYLIGQQQTLEERTNTEVEGIINLLNLKGKEKILDIPSGYGRHSINLANKGFNLTGIDINSVLLKKANLDAQKIGVNVNFIKENMIDINYDKEFDAVINMFYSFGFFESDEENNKVLRNFYNALKPGGKLLFHTDVNIPRILSGQYKEDEIRHLHSQKTLRIIDKYNPQDKRIHGTWIIQDQFGKIIRKDYSVRVYTRKEFVSMCKQVGFTSIEAYGDWNKTSYTENSEDMIIIAQK
ncbi:unnamed protein product [Adineta steineri]|uniref:Methyltransferase domain-containing protein n=1 Tax=Adineta steineri TaxID=433720 RepID=A0A815QBU1_9BILA|nr:unnamed protein product [Adineta steineri]